MIPGANPRQLKQMMRQMGISQEDIDATQVIIKTPSKNYVFDSPSVQKVSMQGQITFQLSGDFTQQEVEVEAKISADDISTVAEQAGVSKDEARMALEESKGDIAQAIVNLSE